MRKKKWRLERKMLTLSRFCDSFRVAVSVPSPRLPNQAILSSCELLRPPAPVGTNVLLAAETDTHVFAYVNHFALP
jgi:hypothetical protein